MTFHLELIADNKKRKQNDINRRTPVESGSRSKGRDAPENKFHAGTVKVFLHRSPSTCTRAVVLLKRGILRRPLCCCLVTRRRVAGRKNVDVFFFLPNEVAETRVPNQRDSPKSERYRLYLTRMPHLGKVGFPPLFNGRELRDDVMRANPSLVGKRRQDGRKLACPQGVTISDLMMEPGDTLQHDWHKNKPKI